MRDNETLFYLLVLTRTLHFKRFSTEKMEGQQNRCRNSVVPLTACTMKQTGEGDSLQANFCNNDGSLSFVIDLYRCFQGD